MCEAAGIREKKTNHSLRATGATSMFSSNVPQRMIQSYTEHRSLEALRKYERPSQNQYQKGSEILTAQDKRVFGQEITNLQTTQSSRTSIQSSMQSTASQLPGMLFGSMANCTVSISPQNFVVNINPQRPQVSSVEEEFDSLITNTDFGHYWTTNYWKWTEEV